MSWIESIRLVKDFMALARPEEPRCTEVDVTKSFDDIVHFIQPEAALLGVEFHSQVPPEPLFMMADPRTSMKQVLLNIVQNALHACKAKGSVWLNLDQTDDMVVITVADTRFRDV